MRERCFSLPGRGPGTRHQVLTLSFGDPDARPHVHVQGGLHADEGPGMMVARLLADLLAQAEAAGRLRGHVTVVPFANPLGLGQVLVHFRPFQMLQSCREENPALALAVEGSADLT